MANKVAARPNRGAVRRDCWKQSFSFIHSAVPTVVMGVHDCCGGWGRGCGEKLLRRPLRRSDGSDDSNAINFPLRSLRRDSNNGGIPIPRRSSYNIPALTNSY